MGIRNVLTILFLFLMMSLPLFTAPAPRAGRTVIRVPNDFSTIQQAIDAAQNGSTILVNSGVYYEHLTVNKSVTLLGASKENTIIDGSNSTDVVIITADNVFFDGFTVRNSSTLTSGIVLNYSKGSTISGNVVAHNGRAGIRLDNSENNTVSNNIVSSTIGMTVGLLSGSGIILSSSIHNIISDNVITNSLEEAFFLDSSNNNLFLRNAAENNGATFFAHSSDNNTFFHNNFVHNSGSVWWYSSNNTWSIGGEGNYWDDYVGLDDGADGRIAGDRIGDTNLPWHGVDDYPLVTPVNPLQVFWENQAFPASLSSNSTVSTFTFDHANKRITFNTIGPANTTGYFNISIPTELLSGPWKINLDGADVTSKAKISENQTHTTIYLNYSHSTHNIQIVGTHVIPEYPTATTLVLAVLLLSMPIIIVAKKKRQGHPARASNDLQSCRTLRPRPAVPTLVKNDICSHFALLICSQSPF